LRFRVGLFSRNAHRVRRLHLSRLLRLHSALLRFLLCRHDVQHLAIHLPVLALERDQLVAVPPLDPASLLLLGVPQRFDLRLK
jgi:hypothetical protein